MYKALKVALEFYR